MPKSIPRTFAITRLASVRCPFPSAIGMPEGCHPAKTNILLIFRPFCGFWKEDQPSFHGPMAQHGGPMVRQRVPQDPGHGPLLSRFGPGLGVVTGEQGGVFGTSRWWDGRRRGAGRGGSGWRDASSTRQRRPQRAAETACFQGWNAPFLGRTREVSADHPSGQHAGRAFVPGWEAQWPTMRAEPSLMDSGPAIACGAWLTPPVPSFHSSLRKAACGSSRGGRW